MIRKHFRIKRIVLGLAFAALFIAPSANAMTGILVDGTTPGVNKASSSVTVAPEIQSGIEPTLSQAQVQALRYQAMVDYYTGQNPVRGENSFGAPGPSAGGAQGPVSVAKVSAAGGSSFNWSDAGIGASIAFAAALMLLTAVFIGRRHNRSLASA